MGSFIPIQVSLFPWTMDIVSRVPMIMGGKLLIPQATLPARRVSRDGALGRQLTECRESLHFVAYPKMLRVVPATNCMLP